MLSYFLITMLIKKKTNQLQYNTYSSFQSNPNQNFLSLGNKKNAPSKATLTFKISKCHHKFAPQFNMFKYDNLD